MWRWVGAALWCGWLAMPAEAAQRPVLTVPPCPIDRVIYRLQGAPQFRAGFLREREPTTSASDLLFFLRTPKRTFWFSFSSPNGYGGTSIWPEPDPATRHQAAAGQEDEVPAPTAGTDPVQSSAEQDGGGVEGIQWDAFRADLTVFTSPPQSSDPPPARIFARGLGPALWYRPRDLAAGDPDAVAEGMPIGLFAPAGCARHAR